MKTDSTLSQHRYKTGVGIIIQWKQQEELDEEKKMSLTAFI